MKMKDILNESMTLPVHGKFTFAGIKYDNESGIGVVSDSSNVLYKGFAAIISADDFLKLAHKADRKEDAQKFADMMIDEGVAIGSPFLLIESSDLMANTLTGDNMVVTGHEGRARTLAIKMLSEGYRKDDQKTKVSGNVVVHFFLRGGFRSRHLKPEFFTHLKLAGLTSEDGEHVRVNFKGIIHDPTWS